MLFQTSQSSPTSTPNKTQSMITKRESLDDDTSELMQIRVASPLGVLKGSGKGPMVKIMSPSQGKSVIIPKSNPQILKQIQERPTKAQVTQQFLQSLAVQTKQVNGRFGRGKFRIIVALSVTYNFI